MMASKSVFVAFFLLGQMSTIHAKRVVQNSQSATIEHEGEASDLMQEQSRMQPKKEAVDIIFNILNIQKPALATSLKVLFSSKTKDELQALTGATEEEILALKGKENSDPGVKKLVNTMLGKDASTPVDIQMTDFQKFTGLLKLIQKIKGMKPKPKPLPIDLSAKAKAIDDLFFIIERYTKGAEESTPEMILTLINAIRNNHVKKFTDKQFSELTGKTFADMEALDEAGFPAADVKKLIKKVLGHAKMFKDEFEYMDEIKLTMSDVDKLNKKVQKILTK